MPSANICQLQQSRFLVDRLLMTYQVRDGVSIEGEQYSIERYSNRGKFYAGLSWTYLDLYHSIPYSGGLLIGTGNIIMTFGTMLHFPIYVYEKVCEVMFELGCLIEIMDYSDRMVEARDRVSKYNEKIASEFTRFPYEIEQQILEEYFYYRY